MVFDNFSTIFRKSQHEREKLIQIRIFFNIFLKDKNLFSPIVGHKDREETH